MRAQTFSSSTCRCCQYYKPEGRRGGTCQQLGVHVRGCWATCSLGAPAFDPYRDRLQAELERLEHSLALDCSAECPVEEDATVKPFVPSARPRIKAM